MKLGGLLAGMGRADWQGAAKTVNDMTDSAVNRESGRINQAMSKMKLAEMMEEDKKQNTFYPASVLKGMIGKDLSDETFNLMMEDMGKTRLMKNLPGVGQGITERNLKTFMTMKDNTYALNRKYLAADINSLDNERQRLEEQLKDPKLADKTGELEKIQAQLKMVNTRLIEKSNIIIGEDEKAKRIAISTQNKGWIEDFYRNPENKARSDALRQMGVGFDYAEEMFTKGMMTPQQFMEYLRHITEKSKGTQNIKTYYKIDPKGNVLGSTSLDENDPSALRRIQEESLVPSTDPRITANEQAKKFNLQQGEIKDRADERRRTRIVEQFNNDPSVRRIEQTDQFSQLIIDVANSDNPVGHASLPTLMARAATEVGNLAEADRKPFGGSKSLDQRMEQVFTELYSGKKTPENLKFISDLAQTFQKSGIRKRSELAKLRAKQYSAAFKGKITEDDIYEMLSPLGDEVKQTEQGGRQTDPRVQALQQNAKNGDAKAQQYLKSKGIGW